MTIEHNDIIIAGGGLAGMISALAFAQAGFNTVCIDPSPPITDRADAGADLRTTAFLQPAQAFLNELGLWDKLAGHATRLDVMRIIDAGGPDVPPVARVAKDFKSTELSDLPFGWNIPNWLSRRILLEAINAQPNITFKTGLSCETLFTRDTEARVRLSDGVQHRAKLVIAADGRHSKMREQAGIDVTTTRFGQKALAFAITHPIPHENISTEIHRSGGPFTLVPLPDHRGQPSSAVVWMESGTNATGLMSLSEKDFERAMTERSCSILGPLQLVTRRSVWPIIAQLAKRLSGQRVALIAEAAHVVPPIGAQGLNMSLTDIKTLRDLAVAAPDSLGSTDMLDRYHTARYRDLQIRVQGITLLNKTSMVDLQSLRDVRAAGLTALYALPQVRKTLMQMGLGAV